MSICTIQFFKAKKYYMISWSQKSCFSMKTQLMMSHCHFFMYTQNWRKKIDFIQDFLEDEWSLGLTLKYCLSVVNFTNILSASFMPIFLRLRRMNLNLKYKKAANETFATFAPKKRCVKCWWNLQQYCIFFLAFALKFAIRILIFFS